MTQTIKNLWLWWVVLALSACQAVPTPLPTPTPTATAGPTPTLTPPPTSTPFPTPIPVIRVESGDRVLFFGDYEQAHEQYLVAFNESTDRAVQAAALWGLGRTELEDGNYQSAIDTLTRLVNEYPESTYAARAYFLIGQAYFELGQYLPSTDAYNTYLTRVPGVLDAYVQEYRGDALYKAGDYTNAINAYSAALSASRLDDGLNLQIKIAQSRFDFGDYAGALTLYDQIFNYTTNDYIRAQMDYFAGNTHIKLGRANEAHARYLHTVENYPLSTYSYLALIELVDANVTVSDLDRGLVDYFAGQYDIALVALDRYIEANPVNDGTAFYYRALTLREMQRTQDAILALDNFIKAYPVHPRWTDAWEEKAFLEWAVQGEYETGAKTFLDFVAAVPTSSSAPDFLMSAARVTERNGKLEEAAQIWERAANEYPSSEQASDALFLAGIARYRLADFNGALALFQRGLILSTRAEDLARAHLWTGKTQEQLGDRASAEKSWQQAQLTDPTGYYSLRAQDILLKRQVFASPPSINLDIDLAKERKDAEIWIRITFGLPADTDLSGPGTLAQDARFIRGTELWELGMYDEARREFESLRESIQLNPTDSFRLANHLHDIGLYRTAIFAAREVLKLAGLESQSASLTAPAYFNHVRYGLYYRDLILPEEERYGLDPLFMFSVIRQESLFEGFVRSTAGAHGLMQIIQPTGAQIADELNWPPNYSEEDLYRPNVSVRFGAYYLDKNRDLLGGSIYGTLAAYNAGPGNALVWKELAGDDPDLLLEIIRFQETRDYIRLIYEIYSTYRNLYSRIN
ncbi:MAG TPA: tetratricopeptide repeat protein [Anaerolineales bacterium]|nr:tetratricopeptide repeat protein [Anaerolineales bacterium]